MFSSNTLIFMSNIIFIGLLPIICRYISVSANHSRVFLSTISGNYMLDPERWIFALGVLIFVIIHIYVTGPISTRLLSNAEHNIKNFAFNLEIFVLGTFLLIAWIPAHMILGMHALLGGMLFILSVFWLQTLLQYTHNNSDYIYILRYISFGIACICLLGMLSTFPSDLIGELVLTKNNSPERVYLLAMDERWTYFALFEWIFYYAILVFIATCSP